MLHTVFPLLAQGTTPPPAAPDKWLYIIPIGIVFVFYFYIIRPQKKKEQQRKNMITQLKRGDRVVTIGGICGEVTGLKEKHVILLVDPETEATLKMNRTAVHRVLPKDAEDEEES